MWKISVDPYELTRQPGAGRAHTCTAATRSPRRGGLQGRSAGPHRTLRGRQKCQVKISQRTQIPPHSTQIHTTNTHARKASAHHDGNRRTSASHVQEVYTQPGRRRLSIGCTARGTHSPRRRASRAATDGGRWRQVASGVHTCSNENSGAVYVTGQALEMRSRARDEAHLDDVVQAHVDGHVGHRLEVVEREPAE
eukprot:4589176-Prymnesium_polylepis.1